MNMKSHTIHIEGLDLAGKSTICRYIQQTRNYQKRNNTLLAENPLQTKTDILRKEGKTDDVVLGRMYYDSLLYDLEHYVPSEEKIIQDSTIILRSIAFHSVLGDKKLAEDFRSLLPQYPRFARSVVLTANDEVRKMRLEGRISRHNDNPEDYLIHSNPKGFHEMEAILFDLVLNEFGGIVVDSSNLEREGEKERLTKLILVVAANE